MWAVRLEDVTKRYRSGGGQDNSLGSVLSAAPRRLVQRVRGAKVPEKTQRGKLALEHVTLEVEEGESYALIGSNGAGKSTALRLISRISPPTSGRVRVRGRVGALIEVSAGVHPELTGRENIWLYGSIIGMPRNEIRRRFDGIVDFSGLASSLDTQVKYYSSGMQLRLGFSIASHIEPDVFVVDEALSVGDVTFQSRCVDRMTKLAKEGTTLLFVSHHLPAVEALCTRGALLADGHLLDQGNVKDVLTKYLASVEEEDIHRIDDANNMGPVRVVSATCHAPDGSEKSQFHSKDPIEVRLQFENDQPIEQPQVVVGISDGRPGMLVQCSMLDDGYVPNAVGTSWECRLVLPELPLRPRLYRIWVEVFEGNGMTHLTEWLEVAAFRVVGEIGHGPRAVVSSASAGALAIPYVWDVRTGWPATRRSAPN